MLEMLDRWIEECREELCVPTAESILRIIEEAGMLPPMINDESFVLTPSGELIYASNEWEEDFEKRISKVMEKE
jgi:hypothetical protein